MAPQNSAGAMVAGVGNTELPADTAALAAPASGSGTDTAATPADAGLGDPSAAGSGGPSPAGAAAGAGQDGRASWAGSSPAAASWAGSDAAGPSPPAQRWRDATVAAYFLITTSPNQMAAVARNISLTQTASKFDQQLRLAGQSNHGHVAL